MSSENMMLYNPVVEQMKVKNAVKNRTIDFIDEFDEDSCYKVIYLIDKIVAMDKQLKKKPSEITIRVNSYGGYCYELWSLIQVIEEYKKKGYTFKTICLGKAMSCGFILWLSGTKRIVSEYSTLLHHSVSGGAIGKIQEMEDALLSAKRLNTMSRNYIKKQTLMTDDDLDMIDYGCKDYIFTLDEIKKYHLATEII